MKLTRDDNLLTVIFNWVNLQLRTKITNCWANFIGSVTDEQVENFYEERMKPVPFFIAAKTSSFFFPCEQHTSLLFNMFLNFAIILLIFSGLF